MLGKLRRLGYAWIALEGLLAALLPRQMIALSNRLMLCGFENPGDLEPREWYLTVARATGVGMVAAGLTGLVLERGADEPEDTTVDIDAPESIDRV
ncbi:MAG: hypothetical protein ACOCUA_02250 [archaeon]